MAYLAVEHLSFAYPGAASGAEPVLRDVCLEVERGAFVLVCGCTGSGKTTLLRHLKPGLEPHGARSGRVLLGGRPFDALTPREQAERVAFVAQDPLEQTVTDRVWHELAFGLENLGVPQAQMRARVAEIASYFGIGAWFYRDVAELSGGQRQLLNLAAAMVLRSEVLVLDEPTVQLDPVAAGEFLATVRRLNEELGTTVIMTEHRLEEVYQLASQVVVMDAGIVAACGAPREVACELLRRGGQMALALPTPARVWGAVYAGASEKPVFARTHLSDQVACGTGGSAEKPPAACPLSVREGRIWLASESVVREHPAHDAPLCENPASSEPALRVRGAWFRYTKDTPDVLRGLDLDVPRGRVYAVVGANGAGKSTLLKAACGVCRVQRGRIEVFGRDVRSYRGGSLFCGCAAMLPQDPTNLFVKETVRAELAEMVPSAADSTANAVDGWACVDEVVGLCGLENLLERHPRDLSGGELQRAALAKVLLTNPRLLLLDEPTKGLDAVAKRDFAAVLARLKAQGVTVLLVSHDIEFCAEHTDRAGMFFDGQMVSEGEPAAFFAANAFYTTAACRMGRGLVEGATTADQLAQVCRAARFESESR